jgi:hypothetical protein
MARTPITDIAGCCAYTARGKATGCAAAKQCDEFAPLHAARAADLPHA